MHTSHSDAIAGPSHAGSARSGKYLILHLGQGAFGLHVSSVREIIGAHAITEVPNMPAAIRGVINLRGKVIPVVDLRRRLQFAKVAASDFERRCIVVAEVKAKAERHLFGVAVDAVSEVVNVANADIEDTPDFGGQIATPFLTGIAKVKGSVTMLLEVARLWACGERDSDENLTIPTDATI